MFYFEFTPWAFLYIITCELIWLWACLYSCHDTGWLKCSHVLCQILISLVTSALFFFLFFFAKPYHALVSLNCAFRVLRSVKVHSHQWATKWQVIINLLCMHTTWSCDFCNNNKGTLWQKTYSANSVGKATNPNNRLTWFLRPIICRSWYNIFSFPLSQL